MSFSSLSVALQSGVGAASDSDPRLGGDPVEGGRLALDNKTSVLNTPSPRSFAGPRFRDYNPYNYTDGISTLDKAALKEALYEDAVEQLRDGRAPAGGLCVSSFSLSCCVFIVCSFSHRPSTRKC